MGTVNEKERRQRKVLLLGPLIVIPLMALIFHGVGGGKGVSPGHSGASVRGLNMSLPEVKFDPKKKPLNKLGLYGVADQDSMRLLQRRRTDPYYNNGHGLSLSDSGWRRLSGARPGIAGIGPGSVAPAPDEQAEELLGKLAELKTVLGRQAGRIGEGVPGVSGLSGASGIPGGSGFPVGGSRLTETGISGGGSGDQDLDKLNEIMDKVLRIRHPEEGRLAADTVGPAGERRSVGVLTAAVREEGIGTMTASASEDSAVEMAGSGFTELDQGGGDSLSDNTVEAVVAHDVTLVSGESLDFRLVQPALVAGVSIPAGTLFSGKATLSGERLLVTVSAIRLGNRVVPVSLEVVGLDGLAGIREPGSINRDVAKESADETIGSLGDASLSTTLGGQAASAGLQTARSLIGRKVRLVRVSVPAGYKVLLRNSKSFNH